MRGVNIFGYVHAESGVGQHTRLLVEAVREAGLAFSVIPYTETRSRQQAEFDSWGDREPRYDVNIVGVNADQFPGFVERMGKELFVDRYTIGLWAWELEEFPDWMAASAELVDEVWANSSFSAAAIQKKVSRPVLAFPLPIAVPNLVPRTRRELGLPEGFLFLFCFDFDSILERKNPHAVIQAFRRAFAPDEGPHLVLKTINGFLHPEQLAGLQRACSDRDDILVRDGYLPAGEQHALMNGCDVYVSLHRSEGFGLTLGEAMALGKPAIATGYSGNLDFMTEDNSYLVPHRLIGVPSGCDPYPVGSVWAEPDLDAASATMRGVWEHPDEAAARGERARRDVTRSHGVASRAAFIRSRLAALPARPGGPAQPLADDSAPDPRSTATARGPATSVVAARQASERVPGALAVVGSVVCLSLALAMLPLSRLLLASGLRPVGLVWCSVNAGLVAWSLLSLAFCRHQWAGLVSLILLGCLVGGGSLGELAIRSGIALGSEALRRPELYAGWHYDEAHWWLRHEWQKAPPITDSGFVIDPLLGWVTPHSRVPRSGPSHEGGEVLIYGDSFTQGVAPVPEDERLPQRLDALLPDRAVHDHAVSGFGLDQIYLLLRETSPAYRHPVLVVGILSLDIDRTLFAVRDAPKPRFRIEDGQLSLENVPLPEDPERWYQDHPLPIRSYLWSLLREHALQEGSALSGTELLYRQAEKEAIARRLLEAIVGLAEREDDPLLFVLFYGEWELGYQGWRERFLHRELERLGQPYLDTKQLFLEQAARGGIPVSEFYLRPPNGHPSVLGNRVVAEAVAARLRGLDPGVAREQE